MSLIIRVAVNPSAGDPDPSGPFSGPIWQEGGPQIAATGNLYQLLGLPNPPMLVFDATDNSFSKQYVPSNTQKCSAILSFYAPPGFDLKAIVTAGQYGGASPSAVLKAVGQYGTFDFQRSTAAQEILLSSIRGSPPPPMLLSGPTCTVPDSAEIVDHRALGYCYSNRFCAPLRPAFEAGNPPADQLPIRPRAIPTRTVRSRGRFGRKVGRRLRQGLLGHSACLILRR